MLYFFEDFVLDPDRRELRRGNALIEVQPQVFDLLQYLVANRDRVVSKDDIIQAVWGGRIVSESALTSRINATRTAVGDNGDRQRLIRTLPRKGIRFVGLVQERALPVEEVAVASSVLDAETSGRTAAGWDAPKSAERRQITIASCVLLLGAENAGMDPEDIGEIARSYHSRVAKTACRLNGTVAHTYGNTAVLYFGYPEAHEDDPERAVRAALELVSAVAALTTPTPLQIRVGIATGLVVVGETTDAGIIGETPNIAAQLQALAEPNTAVIAESTRKLVGNLFDLQDLGTKDLKGIAGLVHAWAALRPATVESRFDALHASGLTELVGREEELELLLRRWSKAKSGQGQVVLLSGEAGIGKSRLTAALLQRLATEPHNRLRHFCSPQHTDSALYPTIGHIERAAGFTRDDTAQTKLDKLDALLAQSSTSGQDAALFADMLSLPNDGRYPVLDLTPQQRRQRTLDALVSQAAALSRQIPLLIIFEDAQWTDPTGLELFNRIVDKVPTLRVLLVVTFRPEFDPPWIGRPYVTALTINRLAEREVGALIDRVVGNKLLSPSVRHNIIAHTDGIPLFVEEMTKAVLEAEDEEASERTVAAVPSPNISVPPSLHASLMARLDRLGAAKEVTQIGAAIGREFTHALLAAVMRKPEQELGQALDRIVRAGLLFRQGVPPHASYLFKHALIQNAAYGTLLREPRRALHARIAETLESGFADIAENQPEILARHCTEAGLIEKAAGLWGKAGQQSSERSALIEAAAQFTRALDLVAALPGTPALCRKQITCQIGLTYVLMRTKGYAASETRASLDQARALIKRAEAMGEPPEDPLQLFLVLHGFWVASFSAFNGDVTCNLAAELLSLAEKERSTGAQMLGHQITAHSLSATGELADSRTHFDLALTLYDSIKHHPRELRFGIDGLVAILSTRSHVLWQLGYPDAALADAKQALQEARDIGATSLMFALFWTSLSKIFCGNYATATKEHDDLFALADDKGSLFWKAYCTSMQGCLFALTGKASDAVQTISAGIAAVRSTGASFLTPFSSSYLAKAYAELGQFDDAWRCIGQAMNGIETTRETWFESEVNRIAGEIALKSPDLDAVKAESYFNRAFSVARQQQAKSWELRAAVSLARLWRDQDEVQQAHELLAPVYGWFTEGFDTRDLKEAKALLQQLGA